MIIGIGTGEWGDITAAALQAIQQGRRVILQTNQVPLAGELQSRGIAFSSLDSLYEAAEDFDQLAQMAAEAVGEEDVFCVLGSVWQNRLAQAVLTRCQSHAIIPGISLADKALAAAGLFPSSPLICSADEFRDYRGERTAVITEVDSQLKASDIALQLMRFFGSQAIIWLVRQGQAHQLTLYQLQRETAFDYSCAIIAEPVPLVQKEGYSFYDLCQILSILRDENGCPWDREQTHQSLRPYLLEESYEVMDAIDQEDAFMLSDELGDVLMQVVFHAQIGAEFSEFDIDDVTTNICQKMIHRHTHIFGQDKLDTAEAVSGNWEAIKRKEKGLSSYTDALRDVPKGMSTLIRSGKIQKKAGLAGFDWDDWRGPFEKVLEEAEELRRDAEAGADPEGEAGDLLFAVVNLLRFLKVNPDAALNQTCEKFIRRFAFMEAAAQQQGKDLASLPLEEQDALWQQAKQSE